MNKVLNVARWAVLFILYIFLQQISLPRPNQKAKRINKEKPHTTTKNKTKQGSTEDNTIISSHDF